jgi:hypothetical protein
MQDHELFILLTSEKSEGFHPHSSPSHASKQQTNLTRCLFLSHMQEPLLVTCHKPTTTLISPSVIQHLRSIQNHNTHHMILQNSQVSKHFNLPQNSPKTPSNQNACMSIKTKPFSVSLQSPTTINRPNIRGSKHQNQLKFSKSKVRGFKCQNSNSNSGVRGALGEVSVAARKLKAKV